MGQLITWDHAGVYFCFEIADDGDVRLLHAATHPFSEDLQPPRIWHYAYRLIELQVSGEGQNGHHGMKHTGTTPGMRVRYVEHHITQTSVGPRLEMVMEDRPTGLNIRLFWQGYHNLPLVRAWATITNVGDQLVGLEYVSSFVLTAPLKVQDSDWERDIQVYVPHNSWMAEAQWQRYAITELGLMRTNHFGQYVKRFACTNVGTWSTTQYLPMGELENTASQQCLCWQIEHNGSWHWEIGTSEAELNLQLSGPTEQEHGWWKQLKPGESFTSVPTAVGFADSFDQAMSTLTSYRRLMRRPHADNENLPVIFNDYMNCLDADPTTEKELPYIRAAAEAGCEIYVVDAGWYAALKETWWSSVGEWQPSPDRFSHGLTGLLSTIREHGMIPGLWVEIEVMGVNSHLAAKLPDDWFFCRHGKRVMDSGRYQLDFRNPEVVAFAESVFKRFVNDYGVGYIKIDYNNNFGLGTELQADSFGDGLLQHQRAYLAWIESLLDRYPHLVIENCSSGGMRLDHAMLERHSIQSITDQPDYRKMIAIAAASPTAATPEQGAIWSYPKLEDDREAVICNMVNVLLARIHQSGKLAEIQPEYRELVHEAITCYKDILRTEIRQGLPIWPLGLPSFFSPWTSLGLVNAETTYLAVWRQSGDAPVCSLTLNHLQGKTVTVDCIYPKESRVSWTWHDGTFTVELPQTYSARLFKLQG